MGRRSAIFFNWFSSLLACRRLNLIGPLVFSVGSEEHGFGWSSSLAYARRLNLIGPLVTVVSVGSEEYGFWLVVLFGMRDD